MKNIFLQKKGFTLIEMMVSLAIFAVVMVVALGAFLKILDINKRAQGVKTAINNVNFAIEAMVREMRVGGIYSCGIDNKGVHSKDIVPRDCNFDSQVFFAAKYSAVDYPIFYAYRLSNGRIQKAKMTTSHKTIDDEDFVDVTSPGINITSLLFSVKNSTSGMPYINIQIAGMVGLIEKTQTPFNIQTTVSQRIQNS